MEVVQDFDCNPLLQAISTGNLSEAKLALGNAPILFRLRNPGETKFSINTRLLGDSTVNMNPLQFALTVEDDRDSRKIIDFLVHV